MKRFLPGQKLATLIFVIKNCLKNFRPMISAFMRLFFALPSATLLRQKVRQKRFSSFKRL
jgi:hypothetical protein